MEQQWTLTTIRMYIWVIGWFPWVTKPITRGVIIVYARQILSSSVANHNHRRGKSKGRSRTLSNSERADHANRTEVRTYFIVFCIDVHIYMYVFGATAYTTTRSFRWTKVEGTSNLLIDERATTNVTISWINLLNDIYYPQNGVAKFDDFSAPLSLRKRWIH